MRVEEPNITRQEIAIRTSLCWYIVIQYKFSI